MAQRPHSKPDLKSKRVTPPRGASSRPGGPGHGGGGGRGGRGAGPGGPRAGRGAGKAPARRSPQGPGDLGMGVRIVHEDADLLVAEKPAGLLTAGGPGERRATLFDLVKRHVLSQRGAAFGSQGRSRARDARDAGLEPRGPRVGAGVIHRLDKEASGLLVFSKTEKAHAWLKEDFKAKRVHRIYLAVVEGELGKVGDQGTIQSFLREDADGRVRSIPADEFRGSTLARGKAAARGAAATGGDADEEGPEVAKPAVTHYRVLGVGSGHTLVQVRLETGRKHQIRVHLADKGHPLVGDKRYGAKTDPGGRIALHAGELGFTHAGTGMKERYASPAPEAFYRLCGMTPPSVPARGGAGVTPSPSTVGTASSSAAAPSRAFAPPNTAWEEVAGWYDDLLENRESDHYRDVIVPGVTRLLAPAQGWGGVRILDVACGQGVVSRALAAQGASVVGVDGAPSLIDAARARGAGAGGAGGATEFHVGDARDLGGLSLSGPFDLACCVMALSNIEPLDPCLRGIADLLKPGGRLAFVITHPAFRAPDQTSWGWDESAKSQYRRVDGYLSAGQKAIQMHPGGAPGVTTMTFHRPLQTYVRALSEAGFSITTLEEWPALRTSQPGPRAAAENRARREIPLFLAVVAEKHA